MRSTGRPSKIGDDDAACLVEIVKSDPLATLEEVRREFKRRAGIDVHTQTISTALRKRGIRRVPNRDVVVIEPADAKPSRYGYTDAHRRQTPEQTYPSCLTDAEWALVQSLFENPGGRGLPPRFSRRLMVDACCYVVRNGCAWRSLPVNFPPWQNVYRTFRRWSAQGRFEHMHDRLREQWRLRASQEPTPDIAILDAQSTRTSPQGGEHGFDAGKKVKGRKRHLVVDALGLLLAVSVTAASVQDRDGAHAVMASAKARHSTISTLYVDSGYAGDCAQALSERHGIDVRVVRHPANRNGGRWVDEQHPERITVPADSNGFVVLPKRWLVERTHAWNERARRLVMHHDRLTKVSETWVWLTQARILLRRLTT
jgi:transposase